MRRCSSGHVSFNGRGTDKRITRNVANGSILYSHGSMVERYVEVLRMDRLAKDETKRGTSTLSPARGERERVTVRLLLLVRREAVLSTESRGRLERIEPTVHVIIVRIVRFHRAQLRVL